MYSRSALPPIWHRFSIKKGKFVWRLAASAARRGAAGIPLPVTYCCSCALPFPFYRRQARIKQIGVSAGEGQGRATGEGGANQSRNQSA